MASHTFPPNAANVGYAYSNEVEMQSSQPNLHHLHGSAGGQPSSSSAGGYNPDAGYSYVAQPYGRDHNGELKNPTITTSPPAASYPAYAHYDIPDRSPVSASSVTRGGGLAGGKQDDEYPAGWTKEDMEAEAEFLKRGLIDWKTMLSWRYWIRKEWWHYYIALTLILVLVILMTVFHDQIVTWLEPAARWMQNVTCGWIIPIAVLFIISFPPLFGHEIVAIICGLVWGLWIGFGIVAAGTFFGEVGNFYAFKYCCRSRAEKYEKKNMNYACLAHVMRHGSFWLIIAARLSAIPGHFTTAVFATCGMNIWIFMIAAILTLPKQLITVYLGVLFGMQKNGEGKSTKDRIISYSVLAIGVIVTVGAAWYIYHEMHKVRVVVWRKQRMELASRGVSLSRLEYGGSKLDRDPEALGDMDSVRPILARQRSHTGEALLAPPGDSPNNNRHNSFQTYHTPFDISYNKTGDMSVYHLPVDAADDAEQSAYELERAEADIADKLRARASQPTSPTKAATGREPQWPAAQPANLYRDPSTATVFNRPPPQAIPSHFPDANPYGAVPSQGMPSGDPYDYETAQAAASQQQQYQQYQYQQQQQQQQQEQHMNPYGPSGGYR